MTQTVGAHSIGGADEGAGGKKKRWAGWLIALGLLALLGLLAFLVARNTGDEGDTDGVDLSNDRQGGATEATNAASNAADSASRAATTATGGSVTTAAPGIGSVTTAAPTAGAGTVAAALTTGSDDVLALAGTNQLAGVSGRPVQGRAVTVESVVADEGFWVGNSATQRVFVFMTPQARTASGESPFQVSANQQVNLTGAMRAGPDPAALGVDEAEGAAQLTAQGQYVEATSLSLAQ